MRTAVEVLAEIATDTSWLARTEVLVGGAVVGGGQGPNHHRQRLSSARRQALWPSSSQGGRVCGRDARLHRNCRRCAHRCHRNTLFDGVDSAIERGCRCVVECAGDHLRLGVFERCRMS